MSFFKTGFEAGNKTQLLLGQKVSDFGAVGPSVLNEVIVSPSGQVQASLQSLHGAQHGDILLPRRTRQVGRDW